MICRRWGGIRPIFTCIWDSTTREFSKQLSLADDVHLIPSFTYWLRGQGETWEAEWPDKTFTHSITVDDRHLITRNNMEIERITHEAAPGATVGATFLYNLNHPVTAKRNGEHFPTDAELCRVARRHSPDAVFDSDKPSWAETVIGAALGMLDTIQVCHNHYNRRTTVPGGWGMIGPLATGESNAAVGDGLFHRTNALYYRFLNCGFRLGVSGGSAVGVMGAPTGYNLVYARIDGALTAEKMWTAIRSGRTFATTGPMLTLTANDKTIGDTVAIKSNQSTTVSIQTTVRSREQLESLEIIHDGRVVAARNLQRESTEPDVESDLEVHALTESQRLGCVACNVQDSSRSASPGSYESGVSFSRRQTSSVRRGCSIHAAMDQSSCRDRKIGARSFSRRRCT